MLALKPKTKEPEEKPITSNHFLEELSFAEQKKVLFRKHLDRIFHMMDVDRARFKGVVLKKQDELLATLWKGGNKIVTISNNEIIYHESSELVSTIKRFMEETE